MAYIASGLQKVANGGVIGAGEGSARSVWHYVTNDTLMAVLASGYFNSATSLLTKGDIILVSGDVDGVPQSGMIEVSSVTGAATVTTTAKSGYVLNCTVNLTDGDSGYVVAPAAGEVIRIDTVLLGGAVATNNATVTPKIGAAGAGVAMTGGAITVTASGSAIGDLDNSSPTAANMVAVGNLIYFTVSGTPGGSRTATASILVIG